MRDVRALTWNVFHGRDDPPDRGLRTLRSRLLKVTERNATHVQVNRPLFREFATLIAGAEWSVCLLQEFPPSWAEALAQRCRAEAHVVLTSRNQLAPLRRRLAHWNPDLLGSWEGGSNLTLARSPWRITERSSALLNPLPRRGVRERRRMVLTTLASSGAELSVANLHASAGNRLQAEEDVRRGAQLAVAFARGRPLIFGGDFNLRPSSSSVFDDLVGRFGLAAPTDPDAIDHLLARELNVIESPHRWESERREPLVEHPSSHPLRLRLSDHAPVEAVFALPR